MYHLTTKDRQYLKARAHQLKPILIIGKDGLTPSFASELLLIIEKKNLLNANFQKLHGNKKRLLKQPFVKYRAILISFIALDTRLFYSKERPLIKQSTL